MTVKKKLAASLLLSLLMGSLVYGIANAYTLIGLRWSTMPVTYYYDSFSHSRTQTSTSHAVSAWNSTDATLNFSATHKIYISNTSNSSVDWDGIAYLVPVSVASNYLSSVSIVINSAKTATWNSTGARNSVVAHEFGHALGLAHSPYGSANLMNSFTWGTNSRYGHWNIQSPTIDDRNGVNFLY